LVAITTVCFRSLAELGILDDVERAGFRGTELAFWDHANRDAVRFAPDASSGVAGRAAPMHRGFAFLP
jgi:hypothetical protein